MSQKALWKVSIGTTAESEEAMAEFLQEEFRLPASIYNDLEAGTTTVCLWSPSKPRISTAVKTRLRLCLNELRGAGLATGPARLQIKRVRQEDWAESWKRHFKPLLIRRRLVIQASWHRRRARPGETVLTLDPGLSFGTGNHPTTAFCLDQLVAHYRKGQSRSFLDVGTGSGILALSAAAIGYGPVDAFDFDPDAVSVACANATQNRLADRVRIWRGDITRIGARGGFPTGAGGGCRQRRYDFICANLISNLLMDEHRRLVSWLAPGGVLVLAGILTEEFPRVQLCFEAAGLTLLASQARKEWTSGSFRQR